MIYKLSRSWKQDGIWSIVPEGCSFAQAGAYLYIGKDARIGDGATIGNWAAIGKGAAIGDRAKIGDGATISYRAKIGEGTKIGEWAIIGKGATIGDRATIGPYSTGGIDIGFADGYRKCTAQVNGVAYIGAGCRWFTLQEAINHWSNHAQDRTMTMCLLQSAIAIADAKGWKYV